MSSCWEKPRPLEKAGMLFPMERMGQLVEREVNDHGSVA